MKASILHWDVPQQMTKQELAVAKHLKRIGKFYVFLREVRHLLFDESFEAQMAQGYKPRGQEPLPPALLATVTLLQAYDDVGDANAVVTAKMDKRWQLVLGTLGSDDAPFSQGVLSSFRQRMIDYDLDQKLIDRTVELAKETGKFSWQHLKAQLDSSPLIGAGRVEDVWNLIGRALSTVVTCASKALDIEPKRIATEAGLKLIGASSLKAALDIEWDDPEQKAEALERLLSEVDALESWVAENAPSEAEQGPFREALEALRLVLEQDLEPDPDSPGRQRIRRGTAKERMPSLGDPQMRHGRKSKAKCFIGYKRHICQIGQPAMVATAVAIPANRPEQEAVETLMKGVDHHGQLAELDIDRGYLGAAEIKRRWTAGVEINCKPWPLRNGGLFTKADFELHLAAGEVKCPAGHQTKISEKSGVARFSSKDCGTCPRRAECTRAKSPRGRSLTIHPQEELLVELRVQSKSPEGRQKLRERVSVEHKLARVSWLQGPRARYKGSRKNTLDLRRHAVVANLFTLERLAKAA